MFRKYLLYAEQNYAYAMLRPLQEAIRLRGDEARWFLAGHAIDADYLREGEQRLADVEAVKSWCPDAVLVPGNTVPSFIPGLKVAIFHGFNVAKASRSDERGHFNIRGCFDLYCTQGPDTTLPFKRLADKHGYFRVVETGWPALDPLFSVVAAPEQDRRPRILYCSTFTPSLTSAPYLVETICKLSQRGDWDWTVQFHPKMAEDVVAPYRAMTGEHLRYVETDDVLPLLREADVMVCDTSSMIPMFLVQHKPVVTFRNQSRGSRAHLLDVLEPQQLEEAIALALSQPVELMEKIAAYVAHIHPYRDGRSSERVLDAVEAMLCDGRKGLKDKPWNLLRNLKERRKLGYWRT